MMERQREAARGAGAPGRTMRSRTRCARRAAHGARARRHQREYLQQHPHHDLTFGIGPAGTGKTYLAVACAVEALQSERVRRIVLVRPAVEAGERLGFLPGDLSQKVDPYLRPMYDALYEMMGFERVARFIERNVIEVAPLAFMRGRSLNDSFVILDEAQNTTNEQMKMFLTRIGFGSQGGGHRRHHADRPAERKHVGPAHVHRHPARRAGIAFTMFDAARRGAPSAGAAHRAGLRGAASPHDESRVSHVRVAGDAWCARVRGGWVPRGAQFARWAAAALGAAPAGASSCRCAGRRGAQPQR
jgi:hypothetical protein